MSTTPENFVKIGLDVSDTSLLQAIVKKDDVERRGKKVTAAEHESCVAEPSGSPPGPAHVSQRRHPSAAIESARLLLARRYLQRGRSIPFTPQGCCERTAGFCPW